MSIISIKQIFNKIYEKSIKKISVKWYFKFLYSTLEFLQIKLYKKKLFKESSVIVRGNIRNQFSFLKSYIYKNKSLHTLRV